MTEAITPRRALPRPDRRRLILTAALFSVLLAPALASEVLGVGAAGIYLVLGTIAVLPVGLALGRPVAFGASLGASVAAAVILALGSGPWAAGAWMAVLGLAAGIATVWSLEVAFTGAATTAAVLVGGDAEPWAPLAIAVGGVYGSVVAGILSHGSVLPRAPLDPRRAAPYATILAIGLGLLTAVPLALDVSHGYWASVTVLALAAPWPGLTTGRTAERVAGTLAGAIAALLVAFVLPIPGLLVTLAVVTGFAGVYYLDSHTRRTALLTAAIVLVGGSGGAAEVTAVVRVAMVGLAALVVILIALVLRWASSEMPVPDPRGR